MPTRSKRHVIRSEKQMKALVSAARQEIVDVLADMGTVSVAEIAEALGRPADALYFHIRALHKAGLVKLEGFRRRGGRQEALYRTVAPELSLRYEPKNSANRKVITAIIGSMLRLGTRDFRRAFLRTDVNVAGPRRELWGLRKAARLSMQEVAALNRHIQDLSQGMSRPHKKGRLYGVTVLIVPLDRPRRGRTGKAAIKPRKKK